MDCGLRDRGRSHRGSAGWARAGEFELVDLQVPVRPMALLRRHWIILSSQWWRWRHRRLWSGRCFDLHDEKDVLLYAIFSVRDVRRDIFLLHRFDALSYEAISERIGMPVADVMTSLAQALAAIDRTLSLIERRRGQVVGR